MRSTCNRRSRVIRCRFSFHRTAITTRPGLKLEADEPTKSASRRYTSPRVILLISSGEQIHTHRCHVADDDDLLCLGKVMGVAAI